MPTTPEGRRPRSWTMSWWSRRREAGHPSERAVAGEDRPSAAVRVVIVEDEPDLRLMTRHLLERSAGFEIAGEADDGIEALEMVAALEPDVVLLDLVIPRLDGRRALPLLAKLCPRAMIVVISGLMAGTEERPAVAAGAFAYVEKTEIGLDLPELLAELYQQFRKALEGETVWAPGGVPWLPAGRPPPAVES